MVSASSSSDSNAPVKLGRGSYIWQALWDQARSVCLPPAERSAAVLCTAGKGYWLHNLCA